ncbi:PDF receptor [Copidosoma floridanum]|uniref:PDF receptor n=1 Tax=Copidosoma floridanum TaxID=29053 RepID=UPI0006C96780|nr:PDF receptor [Copidosoma floridanum]
MTGKAKAIGANFSGTNSSNMECEALHRDFVIPDDEIWCNWTFDSILCWPPTKASTMSRLRCPQLNGVDTRNFVEKRCGENGSWEGKVGELSPPSGWTNYTPCFTPEMMLLLQKLYTGSEDLANARIDIAAKTRYLEFVGLTLSLTALLVSLSIFCRFRTLRNTRTRIHKNLFVAMMVQVVIKLTLYIDQALSNMNAYDQQYSIQNTPILCEGFYVLLEYARTAMFTWMFIEGFFLHNKVTVAVFTETSGYQMYRVIGWGYPIFMTAGWTVVTAIYYHPSKCWWGYNLTFYFWILEGTRLAMILFNCGFLLNILRVLIIKLRRSHMTETEQIIKAVKAVLVLLPLLGITNLAAMSEAPLDKSILQFALWSYITHFLTSFQGLFIAFLYCFSNNEVRSVVNRTISLYFNKRQSSGSGCQPHRIVSTIDVEATEESPTGCIRLCCCRGSISSLERANTCRTDL